jgi:hypothetical protein
MAPTFETVLRKLISQTEPRAAPCAVDAGAVALIDSLASVPARSRTASLVVALVAAVTDELTDWYDSEEAEVT